jgi:hypothetical protein
MLPAHLPIHQPTYNHTHHLPTKCFISPEMSIGRKGKGEDNSERGIDDQIIQETVSKLLQFRTKETSDKLGNQNQF